jgi:hypothetical protein
METSNSEDSQDYAQEPQKNCTFMNSASGHLIISGWLKVCNMVEVLPVLAQLDAEASRGV